MTRIRLVVSDVDGTLLTSDKTLTDPAKGAVRRLKEAGISFTIVSSRPTLGMHFLIEPLALTLPFGSFNGSSIVDPALKPIEQHVIPAATAQRSIDVLSEFGTDIWLFTNEEWLTRNPDGEYVPHEERAIKHGPVIVDDFTPYLNGACKIVGASSDAALLQRCEAVMQQAWARRPPPFARRAIISTSRHRATTRALLSKRWPAGWTSRPTPSPPSAICRTICRCSQRAASRLRWAMQPTTSNSARRMSRRRTPMKALQGRSITC